MRFEHFWLSHDPHQVNSELSLNACAAQTEGELKIIMILTHAYLVVPHCMCTLYTPHTFLTTSFQIFLVGFLVGHREATPTAIVIPQMEMKWILGCTADNFTPTSTADTPHKTTLRCVGVVRPYPTTPVSGWFPCMACYASTTVSLDETADKLWFWGFTSRKTFRHNKTTYENVVFRTIQIESVCFVSRQGCYLLFLVRQ